MNFPALRPTLRAEMEDEDKTQPDRLEVRGRGWMRRYTLAIFGGGGTLLAAAIVWWLTRGPFGDAGGVGLYAAGALVVVAALIAYLGVRNAIAEAKIGEVEVDWQPRPLDFGEDVRVTVRLEPESAGVLDACDIDLVGLHYDEHVDVHGERQTGRVNVYKQRATAHRSDGFDFEAGEPAEFSTTLDLPDSVDGRSADHYEWNLHVHVDIEDFPDWTDTIVLHEGGS